MVDWKREAVEDLRSYNRRRHALDSLHDQIAQLNADAVGIKSATGDGTPVSGGGSSREDRLLNNIVRRSQLEQNMERTRKWCRTIQDALACLHPDDRLILDRMYINRQKGHIERLCEELNIEKSSAYRKADNALLRYVQAYYGCTVF